jgi:hypothetical protein
MCSGLHMHFVVFKHVHIQAPELPALGAILATRYSFWCPNAVCISLAAAACLQLVPNVRCNTCWLNSPASVWAARVNLHPPSHLPTGKAEYVLRIPMALKQPHLQLVPTFRCNTCWANLNPPSHLPTGKAEYVLRIPMALKQPHMKVLV